MTGLEKNLFKKTMFKPYLWLQYLNDIWMYIDIGIGQIKEFFNSLNVIHFSRCGLF